MNQSSNLLIKAASECNLTQHFGRIERFEGLTLESRGPDVSVGEICHIDCGSGEASISAEVVGFRNEYVLMMPYQQVSGLYPGAKVYATGKIPSVLVGRTLLGRVINAFGEPIDGKGQLDFSLCKPAPLFPSAINPMERELVKDPLATGVNVIDSLITIGKGQRLGVLAGSGVGKSSLLGSIAKNSDSDVNVIALIGERGREVVEFVQDILGDALAHSIVVVATADEPALTRSRAAFTATAIAEYFCSENDDVLLLMDSITRLAIAQRDIGLASGELPSIRGYTPSCFTVLPRLIERAGNFRQGGSITGVYSVLVEGDDFNEPVTDNLRAVLDGHLVLDRHIANKGIFPSINMLSSLSRLRPRFSSSLQANAHEKLIAFLSAYEQSKDLIEIGAYTQGDNKELDKAVFVKREFEKLLKDNMKRGYKLQQFEDALRKIISYESSSPIKATARPVKAVK